MKYLITYEQQLEMKEKFQGAQDSILGVAVIPAGRNGGKVLLKTKTAAIENGYDTLTASH